MKNKTLDLPIDIEKKKKDLLTIKIVLLLLTSNLLTYLVSSPSQSSTSETIVDTPNHIKIYIPLKVLFTIGPNSKTLATIIDQNNHIVFKKVYIQTISPIDSSDKNAYSLEESSETIKKFQIEVPDHESAKIKIYKDKILFALPYNHQDKEEKSTPIKKSLEFNI